MQNHDYHGVLKFFQKCLLIILEFKNMNGYSLEFVIFKICHVNETTKHLNIECDNIVMYGMPSCLYLQIDMK